MAISTRWVPSPVMRPAHSPSTMARPSSLRPSSAKNSTAASRSSTTMPTLSIRLTVTLSPWRPMRWLEHAVVVRGSLRNGLQHVPVLDHFAVRVQPKDVYPRPVTVPGPLLVAVQDHVVTLGDHPLELHVLPRVLPRHPFEVRNEGDLPIRHHRIV